MATLRNGGLAYMKSERGTFPRSPTSGAAERMVHYQSFSLEVGELIKLFVNSADFYYRFEVMRV